MPVVEHIDRITIRYVMVPVRTIPDPFGIDDPCPMNAGGPHCDVVECHEIACAACGRIIWA